MNVLKKEVCSYIDKVADNLKDLSRKIHEHPELKFEEHHAAALLMKELKEANFIVESGIGGLSTAVSARHPASSKGPTVALIAEYDALPEIGHACGHNLIAAAALGAALGVGAFKQSLPGQLVFLGTPGEEGGGGKAIMAKAGAFDGVDVAMMVHPSSLYTAVDTRSLATGRIEIAFKGKPAHAAVAPELGVNALNAVIQTFIGIDALRQHIKDGTRVHGIITDGGSKPNIVPEHAAAFFYVRSSHNGYLDQVIEKLHRCAEGAARSTGAELNFRILEPTYEAIRPNSALAEVFERNWRELGKDIGPQPADVGVGSTDMGNVSQIVPAIHVHFKICDESIAVHSREFASNAISDNALEMMITAAKGLAMSAVDLLSTPKLIDAAHHAFNVQQEAS
jgi:amidohydrolase